jgi:hypothetical protein
MTGLDHYAAVWAVDFEFTAHTGGRPTPLCCVARELRSGRLELLWLDGGAPPGPPYGTGPHTLLVAYYASAELGCHLALGWRLPARVLDLYAEFRCLTSGLPAPCGRGLLGALAYHGLPAIDAAEKDAMRLLAQRGGPYSTAERAALLDYCQTDVDALARLLPAMGPTIDLPRALLRGRYTAAVARMEWAGVPIDVGALARLRAGWDDIKGRLVSAIDGRYGVFDELAFSAARWGDYLARRGIPWPRLASGGLALDDDAFREMARRYPDDVGPVRELRHALAQLRLHELAVGPDGRNRCLLSPFASRTGRNQPSNAGFIFGPSAWLRSLIKPGPGRAVAYVDYEQQEFGIAAALAGDAAMMAAYRSGDPYLAFARQAGTVPADATKQTHKAEREQFKVCALAVQYGMGPDGLARKLGVPPCRGRELLRLHQQTYRRYWQWSDAVQDEAMLANRLRTAFGWAVHVGPEANPRSLRNFPMQANGAEMLRLACCLATERGVTVCAPVHDALLVEGPAGEIEAVVAATQAAMREASELVLPGFPLRTDAKVVRHPDRFAEPRGERFWRTVWDLLEDDSRCAGATTGCAGADPVQSFVSSDR